MDQKEALIEAQTRIRNAKNELVIAVLALDFSENLSNTIASLKETIGDLQVAEIKIDKFLE
jgi:hypothetical protein